MSAIGELSIKDIMETYSVGFGYAQNIIKGLEQIGYIKKNANNDYFIIQTEAAIDGYIKEHIKEFRPEYYNTLELKNNGEPTLKAKAKTAMKATPMFICRVFLSPLSVFLTFFIIFSGVQSKKSAGEIIYILLSILLTFNVLCNISYGIYMSNNNNIKLKDFIFRPWFNVRAQTVLEIHKIMRKSNIAFQLSGYYKTLDRLKTQLNTKKKLAEHYANLANTAQNENEFYQSINSCINTLEWMAQFEKFNIFPDGHKPSEDIATIKEGMPISIERFNKRMREMQNSHLNYADIEPKGIINYDNMDGHQFEHFCANILKNNGFINVKVTQGSGDHGIDILAEKDSITYAIQCKCHSSNIGNSAVQQAHSGKGYYHKDIAVVLTNRYFTPQAEDEAKALGVKLWNRDKLNDMISLYQMIKNDVDLYFAEAGRLIIEKNKASIGMLQREFRISFNRATHIIDQLGEAGVIGAEEGTKPRRILMNIEQFETYITTI